ncbi:MAG: hypothetical protein KC656_27375, partial [Myxococcales bacterium]|nr:hypothetical protein [Myxococcales bacterium]
APPPPPEAVVAPPAAEPAPEAAQVLVEPLLVDEAGALLPQTEDMPRVDDPLFQDRLHTLWRAIVEDDPELARAFFFPKVAYQKVKAIADPARDWDQRLWKLFVRDVHAYHAELGEEPQRARFISFDFPEGKAEWMKKHREGNAIGYYRVKRPHLVVEDARGKRLRLEITSLISWRGQWHVVHLHGFQ